MIEDLYAAVGGGQTFYRALIDAHPEIAFCYFRRREAADAARPAHARAVPVGAAEDVEITWPPLSPSHDCAALGEALAYARAVADSRFDLVDCPDFVTFGGFLRTAFAHHRVHVGAIVLSLHGNISDSRARDWDGAPDSVLAEQQLERRQYDAADHRYALSERYAGAWKERAGGGVDVIDPMALLPPQFPPAPTLVSSAPELLCVGRRERRKGNDIAIDLAAWLPSHLFTGLTHIGDNVWTSDGGGADARLAQMCARRGLAWRSEPSLSPAGLRERYARNVGLLAPVRYDTFNLVALEAIVAGCPVAVSDAAGVCDYLDLHAPGAYLKLQIDDREGNVAALTNWLSHFQAWRRTTYDAARALVARRTKLDLRPVYAAALARAGGIEAPKVVWRQRTFTGARRAGIAALTGARHFVVARGMVEHVRGPYNRLRSAARIASHAGEALLATSFEMHAAAVRRMPEARIGDIEAKRDFLRSVTPVAPLRGAYWAELARLERLCGRSLVAAAYDMRIMRLNDADVLHRLPVVRRELRAAGLAMEADALDRQFGSAERSKRCDGAPASKACAKVARVHDARGDATPRVSVLVSLYDAADKLPLFISMIRRQTLFATGQVELVFVDAASPGDEERIVTQMLANHAQRYVFVRVRERETIQAAWNRGIALARGDYITCLGVDESLFPDALATLADALDRNPSLDWVMGDAVVCAVDAHGALQDDKGSLKRAGLRRDSALLDTTAVSWVGGLYRRRLHERVGHYDPTFRAAGDTEFKMRALGRLTVGFINRALGIYLDYPDARASAGPLAEIEDFRAWYAWRSAAGVNALFGVEDAPRVWALLDDCAGYRRPNAEALSTDIEFGAHLAAWLCAHGEAPAAARALDYRGMVQEMRALDLPLQEPGPSLTRLLGRWQRISRAHESLLGFRPEYALFNDNRYQQHSWTWP